MRTVKEAGNVSQLALKKESGGFTLIELMVVVVIIAVLAAISLPLYQNHIKKTRRTAAMGDLQGLAQSMEREFVRNQSYVGADADGNTVPDNFSSVSPVDSDTAYYNLRIVSISANAFTLRATPIAGTLVASDGMIELNSVGQRSWDRGNDGVMNDPGDFNWK